MRHWGRCVDRVTRGSDTGTQALRLLCVDYGTHLLDMVRSEMARSHLCLLAELR